MDDKVFELLEKMYSDLSSRMDNMSSRMDNMSNRMDSMNSKMDNMDSRMDNMDSRMDNLEENMATKQDIVRLEDKMDTNHKVLHDGYKQTYEKLTDVDKKLDRHEELIKGHDLEIKVMRNVK